MGRPKKYTVNALDKAVERYFAGISRVLEATEKIDSGERDERGHVIYKSVPIENKLGKRIKYTEYIVPPTVGGLCEFLGIHRSTWAEYCDAELYPEYSDTTTRARGRMRAWREEQLLTRKDVKGIIFDLQNNYGYTERQEIELGPRTERSFAAAVIPLSEREELLREIAREYGSDR